MKGIRQAITEGPSRAVWAVGAMLIVAGAVIAYEVRDIRDTGARIPLAFYTIDDGKTLFTDGVDKLPPFEHQGKMAVRAYVYQSGGHQWVAYLERYTDEARRMVAELDRLVKNAKPGDPPPPNLAQLSNARRFGRELKRPGDSKWVSAGSPEGGKVINIDPPHGVSGTPELVSAQ